MTLNLGSYNILACGISDIGHVRQNNEDVWAEIPDHQFFILADGMGGHQAGEIAAKETVHLLCRLIRKKIGPSMKMDSIDQVKRLLYRAIEHTNLAVYKMGKVQIDLRGMGTTLCCLLFHPSGLIFAHVGDSRIYCLRNKCLKQMTKDHSLVRELLDHGRIDGRQADEFMYKNIITKAIGTAPRVAPTIETTDVLQGDIYIMCSDGLSDLLTEEEIRTIVLEAESTEAATELLVASANAKGGYDNVTVVILKVEGIVENHGSEDLSR